VSVRAETWEGAARDPDAGPVRQPVARSISRTARKHFVIWTQYQYFFFPMIFGTLGFRLLREDWRRCHSEAAALET